MKPQENKATTDTEESGNRTPMILLSRDEQNNQVRVVVGNSPELLEDKSNRVVAVTDEGGHPRAQGDEGIAIAGYNGTAEGGKAGLAYVKSGTATSGHNAIAVTRGHGTAQASDGGVAIAMRGGQAIVHVGTAIAYNARGDYRATATGALGAMLVFMFTRDADQNTKVEFVSAKVGENGIQPNKPYVVNKDGAVVPAW